MGYQIPIIGQLLTDAVDNSVDEFVIVQLGARYGNYLVDSARLLRKRRPGLVHKAIGVEASSSGYESLMNNMKKIGIDIPGNVFRQVAVSDNIAIGGFVDRGAGGHIEDQPFYKEKQTPDSDGPPYFNKGTQEVVNTTTIEEILKDVGHVDFMEMDIQGAEYQAIPASISSICQKVKMICVRTHFVRSRGLITDEEGLESYFQELGWQRALVYYNSTPITFEGEEKPLVDGVQCWVNTELREPCLVSGMDGAGAKRLRALEGENARLKKLLAERDLEIDVMKEIAAKKR